MSTYNNCNYTKLVEYIKANQNTFYRLAYSYVKHQDTALDIVQESIYKALTSVSSLKNPEYIKTWLYRIIVNTSISYIRKNKRIIVTDEVPEVIQDEDVHFADKLNLYAALDRLDGKHKTVIVLRYFEDLKIEEIAKITECNVNTVKTRLYAGIRKLKAMIEGEVK